MVAYLVLGNGKPDEFFQQINGVLDCARVVLCGEIHVGRACPTGVVERILIAQPHLARIETELWIVADFQEELVFAQKRTKRRRAGEEAQDER